MNADSALPLGIGNRPTSGKTQRMRILALRSARGWTLEKTARLENRPAPRQRFETRPRWPIRGGTRRSGLHLAVGHVDGRKHLPVIELRRTA